MKRFLLSLIGTAALCASAATYPMTKANQEFQSMEVSSIDFPADLRTKKPVLAASSNTFDFNMAGEPYSAVGFNGSMMRNKVAMAFEMTPEVTTEFAGNKITHINFYTGVNTNTRTNKIKEVTVFLSDGDHKTAFYTQTTPVSTDAFTYYSVELTEPYTIEAGKDLYVGCYSILTASTDYAVVVDALSHNSPVGGWASKSASESSAFSWSNLYDAYGYVCVSATLQGDNFPQNKATLESLSAPDYVNANEPFNISASVINKGQQPLQSVEFEYTVAGQAKTSSATFSTPVTSMQSGDCTITGVSVPSTGAFNISVKVSKVNGEAITEGASQAEVVVMAMPEGAGYTPNVVMEEFTGTWCGYCPAGYITMEYIHDKYTDGTFIPVCVHGGDQMESSSYIEVNNRFNVSGSFPNSIINRNPAYENNDGALYPFPPSEMEAFYNQIRSQKIPANVTLQCNFTDDTKTAIVFEGNTEFCLDFAKHNYVLSFGLTEDNVGPYSQANNYSGRGDIYEEWNTAGSSKSVIFNDVARQLDGIDGIDGLIPETLAANQAYPYSYTMTVPSGVKADKLNGIVYLSDKTTGHIVNAATVKAGKMGTAGINDIIEDTDANAPVEYFNLQGIKVENPENGIFIRRQGSKAEKVAVN